MIKELYGHVQTVSYARFTQDDQIVSVSHDSTLKLWDNKTFRKLKINLKIKKQTSKKYFRIKTELLQTLHIPGTLTSVNESNTK